MASCASSVLRNNWYYNSHFYFNFFLSLDCCHKEETALNNFNRIIITSSAFIFLINSETYIFLNCQGMDRKRTNAGCQQWKMSSSNTTAHTYTSGLFSFQLRNPFTRFWFLVEVIIKDLHALYCTMVLNLEGCVWGANIILNCYVKKWDCTKRKITNPSVIQNDI